MRLNADGPKDPPDFETSVTRERKSNFISVKLLGLFAASKASILALAACENE
jgi:hypothetical protein